MAIETLKENLCLNQIIGKSKENIVVEGDVIIPDIKPDILSSISSCGNVCVYKKEILDNKIKIEGGVQVYIMYLADDENSNIRSINTVLDFSSIVNMENINQSMNLETCINIKEIECKVLNGRKINVKAILEAQITVCENNSVEFVKQIANNDSIQVLNTNTSIDSFLGRGSAKVFAKDNIKVDEQDNLIEILKYNLAITNKEIKTSYNKVLIKADMTINFVYLTEDNRINETEGSIPIMGFVDMQDVSDDSLCNLNFEIKNILMKTNNPEEHSIFIEVEIDINCDVYEKRNLEIVQDLYSPSENLKLNQKNITIMNDKNEIKDVVNINESIDIPELRDCKIYSIEISPRLVKEYIGNDKITYEGEINFTFIYMSNISNRVETKDYKSIFNKTISYSGIKKGSNIDSEIDVLNKKVQIGNNGNVNISVDLQITCNCSKMDSINVIDSVEVDSSTEDNIYSVVVYFVKPGDTIWNIAKQFKSTIKAISIVNGIEDENSISVGQQLFIPKFV